MKTERGFTLLELLVVMGIAAILLSFTTINLVKVQHNVTISAATDTLIADLKSQQIKAMSGSGGGGNFGIHFTSSNTYILFQGSTYVPSPTDFSVVLDDPMKVSSSPTDDIIFSHPSGEITPSTITINNTAGGEVQTLTINKYGVVKTIN